MNEEIMKIIPILVVVNAPMIVFNPEKDNPSADYRASSSIMTLRQFGFFGIMSGTIFTFLELFLYQWLLSGSAQAESIFLQLLFRTITPIHILTTYIIALGIGKFIISKAEIKDNKRALLSSSKYFIVGWGVHALWNTINVIFAFIFPDDEITLTIVLAIFGIIADVILFVGIIRIFRRKPLICKICNLEESDMHIHEIQYNKPRRHSRPSSLKFFTHFSTKKLKSKFSCPFCQNSVITGTTCSICGGRLFLACPYCNSFISETTTTCPSCKKKLISFIDMQWKTLSLQETFILGVSSLASMAFLISPVSLLFFGQLGEIGEILTPFLLIYFLMSLIILSNVIIALFFDKTSGMLVLYCFFLELSLLVLIILNGIVGVGILKAIITLDLLGLILLSLGGFIVSYVGYRFFLVFYVDYSPVFPQYQIQPDFLNLSTMEVMHDTG
jgi:hypothetical protein